MSLPREHLQLSLLCATKPPWKGLHRNEIPRELFLITSCGARLLKLLLFLIRKENVILLVLSKLVRCHIRCDGNHLSGLQLLIGSVPGGNTLIFTRDGGEPTTI